MATSLFTPSPAWMRRAICGQVSPWARRLRVNAARRARLVMTLPVVSGNAAFLPLVRCRVFEAVSAVFDDDRTSHVFQVSDRQAPFIGKLRFPDLESVRGQPVGDHAHQLARRAFTIGGAASGLIHINLSPPSYCRYMCEAGARLVACGQSAHLDSLRRESFRSAQETARTPRTVWCKHPRQPSAMAAAVQYSSRSRGCFPRRERAHLGSHRFLPTPPRKRSAGRFSGALLFPLQSETSTSPGLTRSNPAKKLLISSLLRKTAGALAWLYASSIARITLGAVPSLVMCEIAR